MESGTGVVVTYDPTRGGPNILGRHTIDDTGLMSVALAIQNMWLAATAEGAGIGWVSFYEEEFLALLAERPPQSVAERADIVRGAIDARLHPQVPGPARVSDRLGFAVLSGFVLFWVAIALAATGPVHYDAYGSYRDGMAAVPFLIVAMVFLAIAGAFAATARSRIKDVQVAPGQALDSVKEDVAWIKAHTG